MLLSSSPALLLAVAICVNTVVAAVHRDQNAARSESSTSLHWSSVQVWSSTQVWSSILMTDGYSPSSSSTGTGSLSTSSISTGGPDSTTSPSNSKAIPTTSASSSAGSSGKDISSSSSTSSTVSGPFKQHPTSVNPSIVPTNNGTVVAQTSDPPSGAATTSLTSSFVSGSIPASSSSESGPETSSSSTEGLQSTQTLPTHTFATSALTKTSSTTESWRSILSASGTTEPTSSSAPVTTILTLDSDSATQTTSTVLSIQNSIASNVTIDGLNATLVTTYLSTKTGMPPTITHDAAWSSRASVVEAQAPAASAANSAFQYAATHVPAAFTPHTDGACLDEIQNVTGGPFYITSSVDDQLTPVHRYDNPIFPGAGSSTGGGYNVWWSVPEPDNACNYMMLLPFQVPVYGDNVLPGAAVIVASHAGCFWANIPANSEIMTTYCCDRDDCTRVSLGDANLAKRGLEDESSSSSSSLAVKEEMGEKAYSEGASAAPQITARAPVPDPEALQGGANKNSLISAASASMSKATASTSTATPSAPSCSVSGLNGPWSQSGLQQRVTTDNTCNVAPCVFAFTNGVSTSTTLTTSRSTTLTIGTSATIQIETGVDFIVKADVTAGFELNIANAFQVSTATSIQNGTTQTVSTGNSMLPGTTGFMSFIPVLTCWSGYVDCGYGPTDSQLTYCIVPNGTVTGEGTTMPQGTFTFVST